MKLFKKIKENFGLDKVYHLALSYIIAITVYNIAAGQDGTVGWDSLVYTLFGLVVVFLFGLFKEYIIDRIPDWWDMLYNILGWLLSFIVVLISAVLFVASH